MEKGSKHLEKTKIKMRQSHLGKSPSNKGIPMSEEQKEKIRKSEKGNHNSPTTEFKKGTPEEEHPRWRGGKKLRLARSRAKRRQFSFIPLNSCDIDGWVGHHLDYNYVIFIPEDLHKSIYHSITKDINMDIINDKVYDWFVDYYLKEN